MSVNRRKIALAALDLVEREGIESLTMKRVAEAVDRKPASLYNHISGRQDLIEAMRGIVGEGISAEYFVDLDWQPAMSAWARDYMRAFSARPKFIAVMATTAISELHTLGSYEKVVTSLVRGGWARGRAVAAMRAVEAYVMGSALDIAAPETMLHRDGVPEELVELRANLDPELHNQWNAKAGFELGLRALLEGLETMRVRDLERASER